MSELCPLFMEDRMQVQAPLGKGGSWRARQMMPPQPSLRGKSTLQKEALDDRHFGCRTKGSSVREGTFFPLCTKPAESRNALVIEGSVDGAGPVTGYLSRLAGGLSSRRQKESLPGPQHQENQELPETGGEALLRRVKFCTGEGFEPLEPRCYWDLTCTHRLGCFQRILHPEYCNHSTG